jgi:hypothetical protein
MSSETDKQLALNEVTESYMQLRPFLAAYTRISREQLAKSQAGYAYGTDRDIYGALGYPESISYQQYYAWYRRDPLARRIINAPVSATWVEPPEISEDDDVDETKFEAEFRTLAKQIKLWHYLRRADRMAGIGRYSVIFLGFDGDGTDLELQNEPNQNAILKYIRPYSEASATIKSYVTDRSSERFGLPELYNITSSNLASTKTTSTVHWSRVIHIVEDPFESDVEGIPKLEAVFNYLVAMLEVVGGSAEAFWRLAFPGYGFLQEAGSTIADEAALKTKIDDFIHKLQRYIALEGFTDIKQFSPNTADPKGQVDVLIELISSGTGLPKRILTGSEVGSLASTEDRKNWADRVSERRQDHADVILRDLISRLIKYGALPSPKVGEDEYEINWPEVYALTELEQAELAYKRTQTVAEYFVKSLETIWPRRTFFIEEMSYSDEEFDAMDEENQAEFDQETQFADSMDGDLDLINPNDEGDGDE